MKTSFVETHMMDAIRKHLAAEQVSLDRIRAAARRVLEMSEAHPYHLSHEEIATFVKEFPEFVGALTRVLREEESKTDEEVTEIIRVSIKRRMH